MLERRHRLTSSAGFTTATRRGQRAGSRTLVVHLCSSGTAGSRTGGPAPVAQVGFVVSKAVGNAVARNLVKRRLRELVRARIRCLPDAGLLVVRALPAASAASYAELGRDLDKALRHLGVAAIEEVR